MYYLILDSSTKRIYACLLKDDTIIEERYIAGFNDHAKNIVIAIEEMIKKENIEVKDLNQIICGVGPGSYTGCRMAVTVCKMLSTLKNIPLYSISTLLLMSSGSVGNTLAYIDARRGNVFGAIYNNGNEVIIDGLYFKEELFKNEYEIVISENDYIVNPVVVKNKALLVENPYLLIPNYLRDVEAERNLKNDN